MKLSRKIRNLVLLMISILLCLLLRGDSSIERIACKIAFTDAMPQIVIWVWNKQEDLRAAPAKSVGVAYLAETLILSGNANGNEIKVIPELQPLIVADYANVMAVVRIIADRNFVDSAELREQTAEMLAEVAMRPGIQAFQTDFDATRSQRAFYTAVLKKLQSRTSEKMPLSITALLSWCSAQPDESWISGLPIDEAVPKYFSLSGSSKPTDNKNGYVMREPLCQTSAGISTDEGWPKLNSNERIYIFSPQPWTQAQLAAASTIANGLRNQVFMFPASGNQLNE